MFDRLRKGKLERPENLRLCPRIGENATEGPAAGCHAGVRHPPGAHPGGKAVREGLRAARLSPAGALPAAGRHAGGQEHRPPGPQLRENSGAEGIAAAKEKGVRFGRAPIPRPEQFEPLAIDWRHGRISASQAGRELGISRTTFKRRAEEWLQAEALREKEAQMGSAGHNRPEKSSRGLPPFPMAMEMAEAIPTAVPLFIFPVSLRSSSCGHTGR